MKYKIIYAKSYIKRAEKFAKKYTEILGQYKRVLKLLELSPFHPSLWLHKLSGKLNELYSVSINISFRIALELLISEKKIIPLNIGIYDNAYK